MCPSLTQLFIFQDLQVFRPQINPLLLPKATRKEQGREGGGEAEGQMWGAAGSRELVSRLLPWASIVRTPHQGPSESSNLYEAVM